MAVLEPIVVNPPKEKRTYTYSENDIEKIVTDGIVNGKIPLPEVEGGTKFYLHELKVKDSSNNQSTIYIMSDSSSPATIDIIALKFSNAKINIGIVGCLSSSIGEVFPKTIIKFNNTNLVSFTISTLVSDTVTEL